MTAVITIAFDDMFNVLRYADAFGVHIETPNLDRLTAMGVTFTNAYAPVTVCNPSRTAALSGQSPFRTGLHNTDDIQWQDVLTIGQTVVGMFGNAGFTTIGTGKVFHNQGFPDSQALFAQVYDLNYQPRPLNPATLDSNVISEPLEEGEELRDELTVPWAVDQLLAYDGSGDALFTFGIARPHIPFIAPQEFYDLYPREQLLLPYVEGDLDDVSPFYLQFRLMNGYQAFLENNDAELDFLQGYLAGISYADFMLGRLLDAIEQNPALADAAIVIWSDHGYQLGEKQTWHKFTLWEEAANVPFIVVAPGLAGGTTVTTPVSLLDLTPTLLDLAGIEPPPGTTFDGQSVLDFIDNPQPDRAVVTSMLGSLSMRKGDYRFIFYNDGSTELYNLATDPGQITNLAVLPENGGLVATLTGQLVDAVTDLGGTFDPDALTLLGTNGADSMYAIGAQTARGGLGDDVYFITALGTVIEDADGGFDSIIFATNSFVVPDNIEFVTNSVYINIPGALTITGNDQDNIIKAKTIRALVHGGLGDDTIESSGGRDTLYGETGNDAIFAGAGNDSLFGASGDDTLEGDAGGDWIDGGAGSDAVSFSLALSPVRMSLADGTGFSSDAIGDTYVGIENIIGSGYADTLVGNNLGNLIAGGEGNDIVDGGAGSDVLWGWVGDDMLQGGGGTDLISGEEGNDHLLGGDGADLLDGGADNDTIIAGVGEGDISYGGDGDDVISGQGGVDLISGDAGADTINGGTGSDEIYGGDDNDSLQGAGGNDTLDGEDGNDTLSGGSGADRLSGGAGNDRISAGNGSDRLDGGAGDDTLIGGADGARDTFVFHELSGQDRINGFETGVDRLELDHALWATSGALSAGQVIDNFGTFDAGAMQLTLDFGNGHVLRVQATSAVDPATFADYIVIV